MFQKTCTKPQNKAQSYWLALALDMDDCFMHQSYITARQQQIATKGSDLTMEEEDALFIRENKPALDSIVEHAKSHYKRVYVLLGTKRQDLSIDELNSRLNMTISAFHALGMVTRYLKSQLQMPVKQLNYAMADNNTGQIGITYERALNYFNGSDKNPQPQWNGIDSDKFTMFYAHAHLLAQEQDEAGEPLSGESEQIIYSLIDDSQFIRDNLKQFVRHNPGQLPKGMGFQAIDYSDADCSDFDELALRSNVLYGTGDYDDYFMETISSVEEVYAVDACWEEQNFDFRKLAFTAARHAHEVITPKRLEVAAEHIDHIELAVF